MSKRLQQISQASTLGFRRFRIEAHTSPCLKAGVSRKEF